MSTGNQQYPFYTIEAQLSDGESITLGDRILAVYKGFILPGRVAFIDMTDKAPTVRAVIDDVLSHTLNAGIAPVPAKTQIGTGLRHISDPNPTGLRFCRMRQSEYLKLKEWHDRHGRTGGTNDDSVIFNPGDIQTGQGGPASGGGGGQTGGGEPVEVEHPGKVGGAAVFHEADTNQDHRITKDEKQDFERKHPGETVKKGDY